MTSRTSPWPAGVPCWADLSSPDVAASQDFYAAVLGWSFGKPNEEFGGYVVGEVDGAAAAGIAPLMTGATPAWMLYLATDDAEATAAAVAAAGGSALFPVMDVGELGRLGIMIDPSGACFGLWQAGTMIGAGSVNVPGALIWEDLRSTDPAAAQEFYRTVFGYTIKPLDMAGPDYGTFHLDADKPPLGGMGSMMGGTGGSHWLIYFLVEDTQKAVTAATAAGGAVVAPVMDTPYGLMAGLTDPNGALFWVIQNNAERPDWSE